jgi:hypothetical protein
MSGASSLADPRHNRLLAALPDSDWDRLRRHLEPVLLSPGETLYEAGLPRHHAHFPTTAIVSIECPTHDGASTEVALVGREGVLDRAGLEETSCECYGVVEREFDRLLPQVESSRAALDH